MQNDKPPELTLYIVDDDEDARTSMRTLCGAIGYRVQTFASGEDFLSGASLEMPHCVLLDQRMQGMTGLQVHDELVRRGSPMVVVFLSGHGTIPMAMKAAHKGAFDWLVKGSPEDEIAARVQAAMEHARGLAIHLRACIEVAKRWDTLTPRGQDVARLVRLGWSSRLIADELGIGPRTVDFYRASGYEKLWVSNPPELDRLLRDHQIA